ncbi:ADAM metallopeptidase with thrombospondin type 1 motif-like [Nasonia vitripennis]|uniref:Peptidase M12B domain-containing protein n=1 Tax=Nasonia vitripennis TaxID=7425 RepID=A0A7M6UQX8_NASVI|nr:ADAM metallopeptidase with thrombospondin type 1 motif-like [Nasonia vitripennis]
MKIRDLEFTETLLVIGDKLDDYQRNPNDIYNGRYTRDIKDAELLIPRHVHENGALNTYQLPKFYQREKLEKERRRRENTLLHLVLPFNGADNHVELKPYHDFISPDMVIETRSLDSESSRFNESNLHFKWPSDNQCHYRGALRGHANSRATLSLCEGVVGYVNTDHGRYYIEPLDGDLPDDDGQHIHLIYKKEISHENMAHANKAPFCGVNDDWESAWSEQLARRPRNEAESSSSVIPINEKRASSSTHSIHRYIEVALVADRRFLDFHKGTNYEQYLLTVMNMVSDYYHDASVGNQIDVIVVRIVYLEKEKNEIDLQISPDAEKTLESFAKWIEKLNPTDTQHPNHFDIGALVTRHDICAEGNNCNLLGLAFVAAACERKKAACINEDSGLLLGIVIAHEIGHTLGCSHDTEEISGCPSTDKDESYFVMSPIVFIYTIRWSPCSRKFITSFLESGLGECLINNPKNPPDKYKFPNMLPGAMYDADFQCKLNYPGSTPCESDPDEDLCEELWCNIGGDNCKSKGAPPADGTKCAENKWCIHKKCVEMGSRGDVVNGEWGNWGKLGECSRTCGGGIKFAERECNNPAPKNGGRYCTGERKKFDTCNTKPCDSSKPSFRAVQCSEYDKKTDVTGGAHKWQPFSRADLDACALYCINEKRSFMKLGPTTKDGTPCKTGTYNMCISGVCRKVGCDWVIDSDAVEDVCGVCKGGGDKCTRIEGDYTEKAKNSGYSRIVVVPKGSRNIRAYEMKEHDNTLAVKLAKKNSYCLNGNLVEEKSGDYHCAGSSINYKHVKPNLEEIEIRGPITEDIEIQYVFYAADNPGVHYEYYADSPNKSHKPKYSWEYLEWSDCDAKCGGGTKISEASCVEEKAGKVTAEYCNGIKQPPPKSQTCNEAPCSPKWRVSQWSRCSSCGGKVGEMRRKIQCVRPGPHVGDDYVQTNFDACPAKPPTQTKVCYGTEPCRKPCPPRNVRNTYALSSSQDVSNKDNEMEISDCLENDGTISDFTTPMPGSVVVDSATENLDSRMPAANFYHRSRNVGCNLPCMQKKKYGRRVPFE